MFLKHHRYNYKKVIDGVFLKRDLDCQIQQMRLESEKNRRDYHDHENSLDSATFLLFRCFLAFALLISGIMFPQINDEIIPQELKNLPSYIATSYTIEDLSDLMDSMAN